MELIKRIILLLINLLHQPAWLLRGNRVSIYARVESGTFLRRCIIAPYVYIGRNCVLNNVNVGAYSSIASAVQIGGMEHAYWDLSTSSHLTNQNIEGNITNIEPDAWIGSQSIVKQGITIHRGGVIGALSFVNKDVPAYAIVIGSPAKVLKYRFDEATIEKLQSLDYYKYSPTKAKELLAWL